MVYTGMLRGLGWLGLRLCHGCHEGDRRIPDGLPHRVLGAAIERHAVDDCLDDDPRLVGGRAPTSYSPFTTQSRKSYLALSAFEPNCPLTTLPNDTT
jgi:hypothetical protein